MSHYDWQNIFETKKNEELLKIICDKRQYNEEARLIGVEILRSRKYNHKTIDVVENGIAERVRRRKRVSKIKIPIELSFGFDHFNKQKSFRRKLDKSTFMRFADRVFFDLNWYIIEKGENYFIVEDRPKEFRSERHFTELTVSFENEIVCCNGEQIGLGLIIDFGRINNRIMTFINFFDDVITSHNKS
ncbi:hypothetical protein DWB61_17240 [Ancylomarina euxinus]|uniref:Uncharacterized protein n=1 Tax=Ancylomarina euxinus TaxID=2283627 RepID=A0A425XWK5_9BACT|nr:hypothetical protein [Ancylomarina euxinus]MCZ4696397.1 hypothetical protein [Ancylomarina euxinus]RRG19025.1 hypothetical protein DWB61_17240 [Ancylomarina euxinus]